MEETASSSTAAACDEEPTAWPSKEPEPLTLSSWSVRGPREEPEPSSSSRSAAGHDKAAPWNEWRVPPPPPPVGLFEDYSMDTTPSSPKHSEATGTIGPKDRGLVLG